MVKLNKEFLEKLKLCNLKQDFLKLIRDIGFRDVVIFLAFPIIITFLMFLPSTIREFLSFHIYSPKWWQFFTHAFIHKDLAHLWHNIQGYFIFGIILFVFANRVNEKKNLFLLFLFVLVSLPIISSIIEVLIYPIFMPMIKTSQGSSGIVSAILGFLPMLWVYHISRKQKTNLININFFNLSISYVVLLFVIIYYSIHQNILFILLVFLLIFLSCLLYRKNFTPLIKGILDETKDNIIFYFLTILLPMFFMVAPLLLFPVKIIQENSLVDFFMHYIGLLYGIVISFIFLKLKFHRYLH